MLKTSGRNSSFFFLAIVSLLACGTAERCCETDHSKRPRDTKKNIGPSTAFFKEMAHAANGICQHIFGRVETCFESGKMTCACPGGGTIIADPKTKGYPYTLSDCRTAEKLPFTGWVDLADDNTNFAYMRVFGRHCAHVLITKIKQAGCGGIISGTCQNSFGTCVLRSAGAHTEDCMCEQ